MSLKNENYLTGKLLLAMPSIGDPRFDHAVIYICAHDDKGAMGLAINQEAPGLQFDKVLEQLGVVSDIELDYKTFPSSVLNGGPVDPGRGFLLHTSEFNQNETIRVNDHIGVTGTIEALRDIALGNGPEQFLFILGYAGWSAGQLEDELRQNVWLVCEPNDEIIFTTDMQEKWKNSISTLGFDPSMLVGNTGSGSA
ncbi:MAG: hypothetical protein CBB87_09560 [Micavibrio sp. TMED27]|nr:hypothetical protein [Micavibrio sp.]OUT90383.1 MAG: hypothetical protein CBB87_09560 [Micavibrio sp. TMED27]|tara:strand:+ start:144 stop:731 length:588 start_codon:yes stop_codon:yes gene_type:complete